MKIEVKVLIISLILILNFNLISASFAVGNLSHEIATSYSAGDFISGWVNMSFNREPASSLFTANTGNSKNLIDLINSNPVFSFACIPADCQNSYKEAANSMGAGKTFGLSAGGSAIFGFKIIGTGFSKVSSFSLGVSSNAPESSTGQLSIDVLNDGETDWSPYAASGNFQARNFGCYSNPATITTTPITTADYCENIKIPAAPNVMLGAGVVANTGATAATFTFKIKDASTGITGTCNVIADPAVNPAGGDINCTAKNADGSDFPIKASQTYSVCINGSSNNKYSIYYEQDPPICGTANGVPYDFDIYARAGNFSSPGSFTLNDAEFQKTTSKNIENEITAYIKNKYGTDCSQGCIVPVNFTSYANQEISLSNAVIGYTVGIAKTTNDIYNLTETPALINADMQKLYLDYAGFSAPNKTGKFILNFNENKIFSEDIAIAEAANISITPLITIAAYPTNFSIKNYNAGNKNISYSWDFGDGGIETSPGNSIIHAYSSIGTFNLTASIILANTTSSRSFQIKVRSPKEGINAILAEKINNLANITATIESYPAFYQDSLKNSFDLKNISNSLKEIQQRNNTATSDKDYIAIMADLININVPKTIATTSKAEGLTFYADQNAVDINALRAIKPSTLSAGSNQYVTSVLAWNHENMDTKVNLEKISAVYDRYTENVANFITIYAKKKTASDYNPYIIIRKLDGLKFAEDYSQREIPDYYYIALKSPETTISFSTKEKVDFTTLPFFISPEISKLSVIEIAPEEKPKTWIFVLIAFFLAGIAVIIYALMQRWYKKRYEDFLFKNKNDLYNIVSYVQNSKKAGIKDSEISDKLKKAGWKAEQVTYIMKKYAGKGIPGILGSKKKNPAPAK